MNDTVSVGKASLDALTESLRAQSVKLAEAQAENAELRALLIHHGLETADEATEPEGDREAAK